jgi:ligand-binding SRPBCC domain-containing protein
VSVLVTIQVLERTQLIPLEMPRVFSFFEDPRNLAQITPPWLNFRVEQMSESRVRPGTTIKYIIRWYGLPMKWTSLIDRYEQGVCFADRMLQGPYRSWYHMHTFESVSGGVEMNDRVEYEMPLGMLGNIAHAALVKRQLRAIFDYRTRRILQLLPR